MLSHAADRLLFYIICVSHMVIKLISIAHTCSYTNLIMLVYLAKTRQAERIADMTFFLFMLRIYMLVLPVN